jgi:hypothetical protein
MAPDLQRHPPAAGNGHRTGGRGGSGTRIVRVPAPANDNGPTLSRVGRLLIRLICVGAAIAAAVALLR